MKTDMQGGEILEAFLLGIVQGIAEFLPISSSGHLVILQEPLSRWLGTANSGTEDLHMNVALHLGTLLSILVVFRSDLAQLMHRRRLCLAIVAATIPVVIVGFTLKDWFENVFTDPLIAGCSLLVTAVLLVWGQRMERGEVALEDISLSRAVLIGLFQALAITPGISRSGSTIAGGLVVGLRRDAAATFSFLIAIPAISGAAVLVGKDIYEGQGGAHNLPALLVGATTAFIVGYAALAWLLKLVQQRRLHWFAYYCATVAVITITWQLTERWGSGV